MEGNLNNDNNSGSTSRRPTTSIDSRGSAMNNSGMEVDPNWRISFPENSRVKIIDKIISTLQGQLSGNPKEAINTKDMNRLKNMAYTVEANIHSAANSKEDYMRKIKATLKSIEVKRPGRVMNSLPDNSTGFDQKLLDSGTSFMQPSQVQARPQLLSENIQSSITECSAGFASALSTMPGLSQAGISTLGAQTTGMSNMSRISKNSLNNSTAQVLPQNTLTKSPRYEMQAEQPRQQQKQTQTQHHSIYQQQLQNLQQLSHLQHSVPQQLQPQQSFLKQKQHRQLPAHVQPAQQQHSSTSIDLSGQTEQRPIGAEDQLDMIYEKLQSLKETYLPKIKEAKNFLIENSRKPLRPDQLGKVNQFLKKLRQIEACLHATKGGLPQGFDEDKISQLEKHIILFLNGLGTPKPAALQHEEQLQVQSSSRAQSVQLDKNKNVIQQQKQTLVQMQDHHQHLVQAKQLKELQPGQQQHPLFQQQQQKMQHSSFQQSQQVQHPSLQPQQQQMQHDSFQQPQQMQHPSLQQQQQQMQHDSFQQPQQVQHPSLWPQQQQMHHSSFQLPQQVQHPSLQPQQQQMQHDSFQQPQQMHHSSFQLPKQVQHPSLQPQQQQMQHDSFQQPQQMQHPSLQQQMQHDSFQRPQQVQHPSLRPQQQQMQHSSFQLPQQVQHPSFQMQDSRFQQQEQVQHPLLQQQQQQTMQHQQKKHQVAQRAQINKQQTARVQPRSDISSQVKAKSTGAFKPSSVQQRQLGQLSNYQQQPQEQQHQQFYQSSSLSASSSHLLEVSSPEISQHFTPQIDKQSLKTSPPEFLKIENPIQPAISSCVASSHSTLPTPSTLLENIDAKSASVVCSVSVTRSGQGLQQSVTTSANTQSLTVTTSADTQSLTIGTPGISASPLLGTSSPNIAQNPVSQDGSQTMSRGLIMGEKKTTERPIDRLVKMIHSMSPENFKTAANDIGALANLSDSMAGSALARRSKAAVGEDLVDMTRFHLQENNLMSLDSGAPAKKMRRCMSSLPVIIASSDGSLDYSPHCITDFESSKMLSTGTVTAKRPRLELDRVLQPEIQNVNEQLFETVVDVSDNDIDAASCEGRDGIVVKCSYNPLSWGRKTDSGDKHADKSPISPLWLLIPWSYPKCSPVVLNRPPVETIKEYEDLSSKAKAMFDVSVRNLPEPMTLETLARTWDKCARNVVAQYVYERGGDNFNAQCGPWEYCTSD